MRIAGTSYFPWVISLLFVSIIFLYYYGKMRYKIMNLMFKALKFLPSPTQIRYFLRLHLIVKTSSSSTGRMMLKWTLCWTALMGADIHEKGDFHLWHDQSHHQADLGMLKHLHCCLNVTTRIFTVSLRTFSTSQKIHMWCQWALVEFLSIAAFQFRTYLRKLRFALSKTPSRASLYSIAT